MDRNGIGVLSKLTDEQTERHLQAATTIGSMKVIFLGWRRSPLLQSAAWRGAFESVTLHRMGIEIVIVEMIKLFLFAWCLICLLFSSETLVMFSNMAQSYPTDFVEDYKESAAKR